MFHSNKQRAQHGVKALDGGDADAADAVELRALQVLDVVKLGELAAVVGRDELLEFFQGLVAEVAAVDEEEDVARAGMFDEAIGERAGGESLAGAGGHLNQCARLRFDEGLLEVRNCFDAADADVFSIIRMDKDGRTASQPDGDEVYLALRAIALGFPDGETQRPDVNEDVGHVRRERTSLCQ